MLDLWSAFFTSLESDIAKELLEAQRKRADDELAKLKDSKLGRAGKVFNIARTIQGPKKGAMEAHAIIDPISKSLALSTKEIKRVSHEHCQRVLTNNEALPQFEKEIELKENLHKERMKELGGGNFNLTRERFKKVIKKFQKSNKRNYDFLVRSGDKYKESIFKMSHRMIEEEMFPRKFDFTTLHQIYKGKGKKELLDNSRFIHSKDWFPRLVEGLIVDEMKKPILEGSSPYQIGGQPGHQPQEHIFTIKSIMAKYEMDGKLFILQPFDISKFFDKEVLTDVMDTLHGLGVDSKAYRTWSKLNENTTIRVKTGVGYTEWSDEGAMIGQGTGGGALVSQANLDRGVVAAFKESEDEIGYGEVRMLPVMFQDDIMRGADSVLAARAGNVKVDSVINSKQLKLNQDKTCFILFGRKKEVERARKEIEGSPIICGNFVTKEKVLDKWLGDIFHQGGLAASVHATIEDRKAKVKGACYEAETIIEDWRSQVVGGFMGALDLFELAILPTLLYNAETWVGMHEDTLLGLENLQLFFIRLVLRVPVSTPKVALRSETGMLSMKMRIWKKKILFIHHVKTLEDKDLAKQVWKEQLQQGWPGLAREVQGICEELGLNDVNKTNYSKAELRRIVGQACKSKDREDMEKEMVGKSKVEDLVAEGFETKEYLKAKPINQVREIFRIRTSMTKGFKANFSNQHNGDTKCEGCGSVKDNES